ncbi:hypothetical protein ACFVT5_02425 [Streptomyces sp. NPDC058001]|uniref:hypothetical protein n=1 Tax=Streptomyces sp. NPDC058001 TaxID=3346300 RepID=UPI0036EDDEDB
MDVTIRARRAAIVSVVASAAALAGCAVPGTDGMSRAEPHARGPSSLSARDRVPIAPAEPAPDGTPTRAITPEPTATHTGTETDPIPPPSLSPSPSPSGPTTAPKPKLPDLSAKTPPSASARPSTEPAPKPSSGADAEPFNARTKDGSTTLRIGSWSSAVVRGGQKAVDACADAVQWTGPDLGTEDGYALRTAVIVGHDYCGFGRFAKLAVGTKVTATTPRGTFTYRVYANHVSPGRGTPAHGLYWGDLTLQSCVGQNTGFSYLVRVQS